MVCNKLAQYSLSTNKNKNKNKTKLLVSWQFSGSYGVTRYGSGWRKDVVNQSVLGVWGRLCIEMAWVKRHNHILMFTIIIVSYSPYPRGLFWLANNNQARSPRRFQCLLLKVCFTRGWYMQYTSKHDTNHWAIPASKSPWHANDKRALVVNRIKIPLVSPTPATVPTPHRVSLCVPPTV